jgi:MFS family permease
MGQFMGGRFLLGFGVSYCCIAAPTYVSELAHPKVRKTGKYWLSNADNIVVARYTHGFLQLYVACRSHYRRLGRLW